MTYKYSFFAALLIAIPFSALLFPAYAADNRETTFTDPTDAGPDFGLQGEYKGTIETKDGEDEFGAQVIALGNGTFNVVGYYGGLPGDGWKRGDEQKSVEGKAANGAIAVQIKKFRYRHLRRQDNHHRGRRNTRNPHQNRSPKPDDWRETAGGRDRVIRRHFSRSIRQPPDR